MGKVVGGCRKNKNFEFDVKLFMLVVDAKTSKLLNSFVGYPDLVDEGIIGVERLEFLKKPFEKIHAIYFISPTTQAIDFVVRDFNPAEPTYGYCHLVFHNFVPQAILEYFFKT
jgi:syntaxin-binding protein 1